MGQRAVGNKIIDRPYEMPEGWSVGDAQITFTDASGKAPVDTIMFLLQPDPRLDVNPAVTAATRTYVQMFKRTEELLDILKTRSAKDIQDVMDLTEKMAKSHLERFQKFEKIPAKQAVLMFGGEGLKASDFKDADEKYMQKHLRIISGLYGVLRPYDDVKPVRDLPPMARLKVGPTSTVLEFWGDSITKQILKDCTAAVGNGSQILVGCVSDEYWRMVHTDTLFREKPKLQVVQVLFQSGPEDKTRTARGQFARYCMKKRITTMDGLQLFKEDDWYLDQRNSNHKKIVYTWSGDVLKKKNKGKDKDKDSESEEQKKPMKNPESPVDSCDEEPLVQPKNWKKEQEKAKKNARDRSLSSAAESCESDSGKAKKKRKDKNKKKSAAADSGSDSGVQVRKAREKAAKKRPPSSANSESDVAPKKKDKKGSRPEKKGRGRSPSHSPADSEPKEKPTAKAAKGRKHVEQSRSRSRRRRARSSS